MNRISVSVKIIVTLSLSCKDERKTNETQTSEVLEGQQ
jgi:hypothetical protein